MRKLALVLSLILFVGLVNLNAQTKAISGKIVDNLGEAIPGVSIVVKGTTIGTISRPDGTYSLNVPEDATAIIFTFVGMKMQEIPYSGQQNINVTLESDAIDVDEVVVTALGIKKEKKALGYAVSEVGAEQLESTQANSIGTALQGRVAGVQISPTSGSPGASTRVIIRGLTSLTQTNNPLYIIDGIPMNSGASGANSTLSATNATRTVDFGDAIGDLNPEDIATYSVLKGAAATSIYGSRAANGAIIITTKSGKANQKMKVNISSSTSLTEVARLPYYQDKFGQGWSGHFAYEENGSWGPKLNGEIRDIGNARDNQIKTMPFSYQENSLRDFYEMGYSTNNSVSVSGGSELMGYYVSLGNTHEDGVVPGDVDVMDRSSILFKANGGTEKTKIDFSANFVHKKLSAVATGQGDDAGGGKTLFQEILQNPVNHYVPDYRDYMNKFNDLDYYYTPYAQNPYFIINENGNEYRQNRFIGSLSLSQELAKGIKLSWRGGLDTYSYSYEDYGAIAAITADSPNSSANDVVGGVTDESRNVMQWNSDLMLNYTNSFEVGNSKLDMTVLLGNNLNHIYNKRSTIISKGLVVPDYYNVKNISGSADVSTYLSKKRTVGNYAQVDLALDDFLFLQLNGRKDMSSTLPTKKNSFFYPGVNAGFIFTELLGDNNILSYGKIRTSYAYAGNAGSAYSLEAYYTPAIIRAGGFGVTNYPVNGTPAYEKGAVLGNPDLKNELSKEFEVGVDLRFFRNRIGLDMAYYNKVTEDLIMLADIASSSGYLQQWTNFGEIENDGFELSLNAKIIKMQNFSWNLTYNFTKSNTVLNSLNKEIGVTEYIINSAYETEFVAIEGEQLGMFRIPDYKYTPDGKIIVGDNGLPKEGDKTLIGSSVPDFKMTAVNEFSYKNVALSFLFDYQKGGKMYSYTSNITFWSGNNEQSTTNDRRPYVVPNSVTETIADNGTVTYTENSTPILNNWHEYYSSNTNKPIESNRIIDKTYVKLRDLSLSYKFNKSLVSKVGLSKASVSVFGRNLFLWTPSGNSFVDPELSTWGNGIEGLMGEFGGAPSVRSYGVKLNVSF